jgi:hypothetical protein
MTRKIKLFAIVGAVITSTALASSGSASAAWQSAGSYANNNFSAVGSCNTFYGFTGMLNSPHAGGDSYKLRFKMYVDGVGWTNWRGWFGYYQVRYQGAGWNLVNIPGLFGMSALGNRWVKVYMELYSWKDQRTYGDYLMTTRVGGDLTETSGVWCRNL